MSVTKILLTGANGFIGQHILSALNGNANVEVTAAVRTENSLDYKNSCIVNADTSQAQWQSCLEGINIVIHCAARAHIIKEGQENALALYQQINVDMVENLARAAVQKNVRQFIFISTIGVHGTFGKTPFTEKSTPAPNNAYAASKLKAENILLNISKQCNLDVCIIRAPLVYGPGVGANFLSMIKWMDRSIPLPFGSVHNSRSLLGVGNLVNFIEACLLHPKASNQIFLISDGTDISTTQLLNEVSHCLGRSPMLIPVPLFVVKLVMTMLGKRKLFHKFCDSLQVDSSKAKRLLNWEPPVSFNTELQNTVLAYRKNYPIK